MPLGPFDLAFCRFVLCYQRAVATALRHMASVMRPGGHPVAQEAVMTAPLPVEAPGRFGRPATLLINEWFPALLGAMGACWDVVKRYSMPCRGAGLVEVEQRVFAPALPPERAGAGGAVYRDLLADGHPLLPQRGIAAEHRIDHALRELDIAQGEEYDSTIVTHLPAELVARVP